MLFRCSVPVLPRWRLKSAAVPQQSQLRSAKTRPGDQEATCLTPQAASATSSFGPPLVLFGTRPFCAMKSIHAAHVCCQFSTTTWRSPGVWASSLIPASRSASARSVDNSPFLNFRRCATDTLLQTPGTKQRAGGPPCAYSMRTATLRGR